MKFSRKILFFLFALLCVGFQVGRAAETPNHPVKFRVLAIAENGPTLHDGFVAAAKVWLAQLAAENDFAVDYINNTDQSNDAFLKKYRLFIQLDASGERSF
jgi:hypothetical protein